MIALGVHSHYSLRRGTASPAALCRAARRLGYRALALTDTDNLYGLWPFLAACRSEGIEPVVGAELTDPRGGEGVALCLAATDEGYRSLCRLLSRRRFLGAGFDPASETARFASGLLVLAGNATLLERLHEAGVPAAAAVTPQAIPRSHPLRQAARRLRAPEVAVHPAFFLAPDDHRLHRLLRAIDRRTLLARLPAEEAAPAAARLLSPAELARAFAPEPALLAAAEALGASVSFRGPRFGVVLPPRPGETAAESLDALRRAAYDGAHRRYGTELPEAVVERLEHELALIGRMGYAAYFLIVRDIVALSPRTCGRGSAAASLVAYCLGITNVCPLKHNLYFERFLHPGRTDPPDIDVDFAWDERHTVIAAVLARHRGCAARVANHVLFRPRLALRETARAWGIGEAETARLSRRLPDFWQEDGDEETPQTEEALTAGLPAPWPAILGLARRLVGIPRHLSLHPGGVVITPGPITDYAPVEPTAEGEPLLPWDKDGVEEAGLVKIDLLGNRSLAVIRDTLASLGEQAPFREPFAQPPEEDFATQQTVAEGRTLGCFYIESPAMRLLLRKCRVGDFDHLVILSSIIRPAAGAYIREFLRRLHGGPWEPIHPLLADLLSETFGLLVYQEDVARTAVALAGFSPAEADGLRKVLSKKDRARALADFARRFREGARARGLSEGQIAAVWDMMMSFDGYSFCKPHSASYARVSFQAAYLKTHHPAEFMAAVLGNGGGFYRPLAYVSEARRLGLRVLPPDVTASDVRWSGSGGTLRAGLAAVRDLSAELPARIVACRAERPFADLEDFLLRTRPGAEEFRALLDAGALDGLGGGEDRALWCPLVEDNLIERCGWHCVERIYENAGIKLHLVRDGLVRRNIVRDTGYGPGIWLDFNNINARITQNVVLNVKSALFGGIFVEASHRANQVDH
ncbi:MAG: PHP domain-containing protein, partial [Desulfobacterales bacterium]